jgi:hypothetical protein
MPIWCKALAPGTTKIDMQTSIMFRELTLVVLGFGICTGCGKPAGKNVPAAGSSANASADDCARFSDKVAAMILKQNRGKPISEEDRKKHVDEMTADCKKSFSESDDDTKTAVACVFAASDDAAIAKCLAPAVKAYGDKAKKTEPLLVLNHLAKDAKNYFIINAQFPQGKASTQPAEPCCKSPDHKCPPVPADTMDKDPVWKALEFRLDDPMRFQYSYASDATGATATAVGDLDCDGHPLTYTLHLTAKDGTAKSKLDEPQ